PLGNAVNVLGCPNLGPPWRDNVAPHWTDAYYWTLNYLYLGGAYNWNRASPPYSPMTTTDPPDWALMADIIDQRQDSGRFTRLPHRNLGGGAAGSNHLFNDGHVEFIPWEKLRGNADWGNERFFWQRR